jgi:hypothetical protein
MGEMGIQDSASLKDDSNLRDQWQRRKARLPKVECVIRELVVYRDGVVAKVTITNHADIPLQLSLTREPLWLRGLALRDADGSEWEIRPLRNHYVFAADGPRTTATINGGKSLQLLLVNTLEDATLRPTKVRDDAHPGRKPAALKYEFDWATSLARDDGGVGLISIRRIGKGISKVEWKEEKLPDEMRTRVVEQSK